MRFDKVNKSEVGFDNSIQLSLRKLMKFDVFVGQIFLNFHNSIVCIVFDKVTEFGN